MIAGLTLAAPWALAGLAALPALYFLFRATPPPPRRQPFPALRLLRDALPTARSPVRMPLWLLLLRLLAIILLIVGFAGPEIVPPPLLPGTGPVLLAIDNGWASAADFAGRIAAARRIVAESGQRGIVLLTSAPDTAGHRPMATGLLSGAAALSRLGALKAQPWPADRKGETAAVRTTRKAIGALTSVWLTEGLGEPGQAAFITALDPARIVATPVAAVRLLLAPGSTRNGRLLARIAVVPQAAPVIQPVLAENAAGEALARVMVRVPAGAGLGTASLDLPAALAGKVVRFALPGASAPGSIALFDGGARRVVVGLAAGGTANAEQKLLGALYYIRRALPADVTVRTGSVKDLIAGGASAIVLADMRLHQASIASLQRFMRGGGVLIRFAGPLTAAQPDILAPDRLLGGARVLGGSLAASKAEKVASFAAGAPLAGLAAPRSALVTRQVLVDPATLDPSTIWARLTDGTPIIIGAHIGRGTLAYVLTTANVAWSDWPIASDFPALMDRLVHLRVGQPPKAGMVKPLHVLDGVGRLVAPGAAARPFDVADLAHIQVSPAHPPGLWGNAHGALALDVGGHVPPLAAADYPASIPRSGLDAVPHARRFGPILLEAALALLIIDMIAALILRGALGAAFARRIAVAGVVVLIGGVGHARADPPPAALAATLGYVKTGDPAIDLVSAAGLSALSVTVNSETAAHLAAPRGVVPGQDNLNLYPMLYWPVTGTTTPPDPAACTALDTFMDGGGLLVIDTQGGGAGAAGSGAGFDPGAGGALRRATACLSLPPLRPLTITDTLAHTFFLTRDFAGRFDGAPVYIAAEGGRDADGVSPVVVGENDWAGAWATDATGVPMFTILPGAPGQRETAMWFGVNLVMYALTGTYKADQVQIPAILRRLEQ